MESNSCRICAPVSVSDVDQCRHNRSYPKSVRCVMRRNPPASTMDIILIENAMKQMWYGDNHHIIMELAYALKRPPVDVMNFLYKLSFSNFGKTLNLRNGERKLCRVPLATENCDIYFGIFDKYGNLRNPLRSNCLDQLLEIMRAIFTEAPDDDNCSDISSGMFEAMGLNPPGDKGKNDCYGSCVSTGQFRCKSQSFYNIDGQYAGIDAQVLVGYRADAIGERIERLGCDDTGKIIADQSEPNCFAPTFETYRGRDSFESINSEEYGLRKEDFYQRGSGYSGRNKILSESNKRVYGVDSGNRQKGESYKLESENQQDDRIKPGMKRVGSDEENVQTNKRRDDNEKNGAAETNLYSNKQQKENHFRSGKKKLRSDYKDSHESIEANKPRKKVRGDQGGNQGDENQEEQESNQSKEGKSVGFGGVHKRRHDIHKSGGKAKHGQGINYDRHKHTKHGKVGQATVGFLEERRLSPSGKELAKVLENINKTDRIAGNVHEIIDAVANIETKKLITARSKQKDVINEISDHYSDTVSRKTGVRHHESKKNEVSSSPKVTGDIGKYRRTSLPDVRANQRQVVKGVGRRYFGDQTPVLMHEPFDQTKPWTWLKRHPKQLRIADKGIISHSRIKRYRRESIEAKYQRAKRRYSVHSTVSHASNISAVSHAMFGGNMYKPTALNRLSDPKIQMKKPSIRSGSAGSNKLTRKA